ncbi:hypothetical protein [Alloalcanivorax xenomutans]|uniref:Uncharacterized protein n=1 Tax=Alloalcanivorax xenomutans TaxID=1094342 RepID=A0A9Q3W9N1_9GAMM|nr:hypothetical protein [Alloalcanivorax xenomutans]MCE7511324.1 hypothetical protein [Alloalcanivorax xenomutans]
MKDRFNDPVTAPRSHRGGYRPSIYVTRVMLNSGLALTVLGLGATVLVYLLCMMLLSLTEAPDHVVWIFLLLAAFGNTLFIGASWPLWHRLVLASREPFRAFRVEPTVRWLMRAGLAVVGALIARYEHDQISQALPLLSLTGWQGALAEHAAASLTLYGLLCGGACLGRALLALCLLVDLWRDEARQGTAPQGGSTSQGHSP